FIAWVSDANSLSETRIGGSSAVRGFYRMDGLPFADSLTTLLRFPETIFYPIVHDENGVDPGVVNAFSATDREGDLLPWNCSNWTSSAPGSTGGHGGFTHTGSGWSGSTFLDCSVP